SARKKRPSVSAKPVKRVSAVAGCAARDRGAAVVVALVARRRVAVVAALVSRPRVAIVVGVVVRRRVLVAIAVLLVSASSHASTALSSIGNLPAGRAHTRAVDRRTWPAQRVAC